MHHTLHVRISASSGLDFTYDEVPYPDLCYGYTHPGRLAAIATLLNMQPVPVEKLSEILTSIGLEVEDVETVEAVKGSLAGLMIGEVLTCERHPNADKLSITTVNIGTGETLQIVCGAPNARACPTECVLRCSSRKAFISLVNRGTKSHSDE